MSDQDETASNNRVLIVEDEQKLAQLYKLVLEVAGFDVKVAGGGFMAGMQMTLFDPAVVILDLMLPGMNGLEVLKQTKAAEKFSQIKIVVLSAMPRQMLDEALAAGADAALEKPIRNEMLLEHVQRLMGTGTIKPAT